MGAWGKVLKVHEYAKPTPEGDIMKIYRYTVETAKGAVITIDISETANTPEKAEPILKEAAAAQDRIMKL